MRGITKQIVITKQKQTLEQEDTAVLQRKLDGMESTLSRRQAADGECHTRSCAASSLT